jgi:putative PEP-CTERM system histidine kinase
MTSVNVAMTAWGYGLAGLAYSFFSLRLFHLGYWRKPLDGAGIAVLAAAAWSSLWAWLGLASASTQTSALLLMGVLADMLRYGCWFAFFLMLLRPRQAKELPDGMAWLAPVAVALMIAGLLLQSSAVLGAGVGAEPSRPALLSSMALPVFGLVLLEQLFRNLPEDSRWNAKPLCLGLAGVFSFDLYLYSQAVLFNRLDDDALSIRGAVNALMAPLLLLSTTRRSDWLSKIRISPKAAFHSASLLIAGLYLMFMSGVGYYVRYFGGEWGRALQLGLLFSALVLLMVLALSGALRARLRVFLGKHFFRYRYDYREEWLKFTRTLSALSSPQELEQQVIHGLADMVESPGGGLWVRGRGEPAFTQTARWNMAQTLAKEDACSPLCEFLSGGGWVINLEEYRSMPGRYGSLTLPVWLRELAQAWLIVPLSVGEELIGFVVLASARARVDVNWEVNDLLKTAGRQAASFLAQMQAAQALLEARKFDAFNRMSAFVVHDLKNIVTQLSLMLKNAKRLRDNQEFQQDMLMTVENALDRMRQLMLQLRGGDTGLGSGTGVDLGGVVERIALNSTERGRKLDVQLLDRVVARGHEERLERVIGHVVQNAFDATDPDGRVWLKLERVGAQARIEVGDTGQGMTPEFVRDRLFKPFQTTKPAGMGIGAFESFQYVRELGGNIEVDSELKKGTVVSIVLPLCEPRKTPDLQLSEVP